MGTIARSYGLNQLIWKPTHILYLSSSCTDLIFTLQPNLVMESEIHSHLHLNYHHQIIFAKLDLKQLCETTICDDRHLPWINKEIKKLVVGKNLAFKSYCCSNKSMFLLEKFKAFNWINQQYQLNISFKELKEKYYTKLSSRFADPLTSLKTYYSIWKIFLNNKNIPCIPPVFCENKFITNFKEKAEFLTIFV